MLSVLLLGGSIMLGACADDTAPASFSIDRSTALPVVDAGGERFILNWDGKLAYVQPSTPARQDVAGDQKWSGVDGAQLPIPQPDKLIAAVRGEIKHIYLAPAVPVSWSRCAAFTVTRQAKPFKTNKFTVPPADKTWWAQLFDAETGRLLAEFDLSAMFDDLYYETPAADFSAEVLSASIGPDGGVGLLVRFTQNNVLYLDGGIWDGEVWTPLMCIQPPGTEIQDQTLCLGPGNASVLHTQLGLFFSDGQGRLRNIWVLKGNFITAMQRALALGLLQSMILTATGGLIAVAVLGLLWYAFTGKRKRRQWL